MDGYALKLLLWVNVVVVWGAIIATMRGESVWGGMRGVMLDFSTLSLALLVSLVP